MNIPELRKIAGEASPDWVLEESGVEPVKGIYYEPSYTLRSGEIVLMDDTTYYPTTMPIKDARFVAAFNPQVALELLDRLETLENMIENWGRP